MGWRDIEVVLHADGRPTLEFHGHGKKRVQQLGVALALVSLTHSDLSAAAVVILVGGAPIVGTPPVGTPIGGTPPAGTPSIQG